MVGLSHIALRQLVREYMPAGVQSIWPTEMLSSWRVPNENVGSTAHTYLRDEPMMVPQILANERQALQDTIQCLEMTGVRGVDLNMGCPVSKALKHNYGVALMGDADYAADVVRMAREMTDMPISVKLRSGFRTDRNFLVSFVRGLEKAGAAWITLHPRLAGEARRGRADWSEIRLVRESVGMPVIGNGDVQCLDDFYRMREETGCDAVMVGRALAAKPWMVWQYGESEGMDSPRSREAARAPATELEEGHEYGRSLVKLLDLLECYFPFDGALRRFRFHVRTTSVWLEFGHELYRRVTRAKSIPDTRVALDLFFSQDQRMFKRTQLRE